MGFDDTFFEKLSQGTYRKCIERGQEHAMGNRGFINKTIKDLGRELELEEKRAALVISGGPSLHKKQHISVLREEGFNGYIVAADGAMGHCLRNDIIPDFVLTVDPDPHRIIRWFGDPFLDDRPDDDYFRRQDIDPAHNADEVARNRETMALVNRFGPRIKLIISTSVTPQITRRALEAGMELYWWTPLYDDFEDADSRSKALCRELKVPCMTTGGNVGSSCWVFAQAILRSDPVLMVGMDFSYPPGTDVYNTQYYDVLKDLYPDAPHKGLIEVYNPVLEEVWVTDPAYYWYARNFREMMGAALGRTINCTEGGILFGDGVVWKPFREALKESRMRKH
jgi:hypothetical protein